LITSQENPKENNLLKHKKIMFDKKKEKDNLEKYKKLCINSSPFEISVTHHFETIYFAYRKESDENEFKEMQRQMQKELKKKTRTNITDPKFGEIVAVCDSSGMWFRGIRKGKEYYNDELVQLYYLIDVGDSIFPIEICKLSEDHQYKRYLAHKACLENIIMPKIDEHKGKECFEAFKGLTSKGNLRARLQFKDNRYEYLQVMSVKLNRNLAVILVGKGLSKYHTTNTYIELRRLKLELENAQQKAQKKK